MCDILPGLPGIPDIACYSFRRKQSQTESSEHVTMESPGCAAGRPPAPTRLSGFPSAGRLVDSVRWISPESTPGRPRCGSGVVRKGRARGYGAIRPVPRRTTPET